VNERALARRHNAGFTLVELLVALTGGLFISLAVFALSRDSGRFYQSETRLANATVSGMLGFERLRQDIARAGFLVSPNAARDTTHLCGMPNGNWPVALQNLASVRITAPVGPLPPSLAANGRTPPALVLAGSYASPDLFGATSTKNGTQIVFRLGNLAPGHPAQPSLLRLGNGTWPTNEAIASVFPIGGAIRIVQNGRQYYGVVSASSGGNDPLVTISNAPPIKELGEPPCGLNILGSAASMATINTINFVRYQLGTPQTVTGKANYQPMYAASNLGDAAPGEAGRTELIRVEQDLAGADIEGTEEVVAEYAVDFNLQITAVTSFTGPDPTLAVIPPSSAQFATFTGATFGSPNTTPELIRSIRVRLGVRSREGDRATTLPNPTGGGLFRFDLGTGNADAFARVRTFQADVFLHNQADVTW